MRTVTTEAEFDSLEPVWNELIGLADVTVFQTFEWVRTWWEYHRRRNDTLAILVFLTGGRVDGIAPMFEERCSFLGLPVARRIQFLGRGLSDYLELIIRPGLEPVILESFAEHLRASRSGWTILDIEGVHEHSPLATHLPGLLAAAGCSMVPHMGNISLSMALPESEEALIESMGATSRHNYKRKLRAFEQKFSGRVAVVGDSPGEVRCAVELFSKIHGARWKSLAYPSAFDDPTHREFHIAFSRKFAQRGWLRMYVLIADETPVGMCYTFAFKGRIYLYQCNAHGSREVMQCSPGILVRVQAIADGVRMGMKTVDYLRGGEEYKGREWAAVEEKNYWLRFVSPAWSRPGLLMLYLFKELLIKGGRRAMGEVYGYRRFLGIQPRSVTEQLGYLVSRLGVNSRAAYDLVHRHVIHTRNGRPGGTPPSS